MQHQSASQPILQVSPGRGLGSLMLGMSLFDTLKILKSDTKLSNGFDVGFSASNPANNPINITSTFGVRLRFDGPEQRLRLIEVLDFGLSKLTYCNHEIYRESDQEKKVTRQSRGPTYRAIIKMFGPTFPGEYLPANRDEGNIPGNYICSYPGVAFSFPVDSDSWSTRKDVASMLISSTATSMAIFNGRSWPEAVPHLFTASSDKARPRSGSVSSDTKLPYETIAVHVHGEGRVELLRRNGSRFWITLSETTPQDLLMELGPPDALYQKSDRRLKIHRTQRTSSGAGHETETDLSSAQTDESDQGEFDDDPTLTLNHREIVASEHFYNYFHLGIDFLISQPTHSSAPSPSMPEAKMLNTNHLNIPPRNSLAITKMIVHSNVPGTWNFGRYKRCQWTLQHVPSAKTTEFLTSEMSFTQISSHLSDVYNDCDGNGSDTSSYQRGMTLNRGLGASPSSSCELLGGWEEDIITYSRTGDNDSTGRLDSTSELFGYPGLVFEVLKNSSVHCLTVY